MTESRLIDSSVWLAYLFNGSFADILESDEILLISVLSLFEIKRKLAKNKIDEPKIRKSLDYIRKRSLVISVDTEISEKAADISIEKNLPAIDSLIYATALINDAKLITMDNDFKGLRGVEILR